MARTNEDFLKRGVDYEVPSRMMGLPRRYYLDESIYQEELEKIFSQRWMVACREEEIPQTGDYIVTPLGNESIILLRDEFGQIRGYFNVCRHRGTRLCMSEKGRFENNSIRCPYHAWKFDLSGQLKSAPQLNSDPHFRKQEFGLFTVHVQTWGGFVFINLSQSPQSFAGEMGALIGKFDDWILPELKIAFQQTYNLNCNWKLVLQNYQECYHCPGVHPMLSQRTPFRSAVHDCFEGSVIGGYMELSKHGGGMTMDGEAAGPPIGRITGNDLQRVYYYSIFPNVLLSPHPDFVLYHRLRPLAVDQVQVDCYYLLPDETIADPELMERFQSAIEFWDLTNRQDWEVCEQMQLGLNSRRFDRGLYVPSEDILFALDKEILQALQHRSPDEADSQ